MAVVLAVVALGRTQPQTKPTGPNTQFKDPGTRTPGKPDIEVPAKVIIECEKPSKLEDKASDDKVAMRIGSAHLGKRIGYLEIPDGWINTCVAEKVKVNDHGGDLPGKAYYDFEAPRDDTYYLFLRAKWYDSCGDSVWLRLDAGPFDGIEDTIGEIDAHSYRWAWHPLMDKGQLKPFKLSAGKHTLVLATKEDGPLFDKVLLSTDATAPLEDVVDP